jgi:hypothetical protein
MGRVGISCVKVMKLLGYRTLDSASLKNRKRLKLKGRSLFMDWTH